MLDFGDGNDTLNVAKGSVLEVEDIVGVDKITAAKGSIIVFHNDENDIKLDGVKGSWQNAELVDINDLDAGANAGAVYANEWDVYTFTADDDGAMLRLNISDLAEGNEAIVECQIGDEWVVYNAMYSLNLDANESTLVRVSIDGDYADKYDKKSYTLNATIA